MNSLQWCWMLDAGCWNCGTTEWNSVNCTVKNRPKIRYFQLFCNLTDFFFLLAPFPSSFRKINLWSGVKKTMMYTFCTFSHWWNRVTELKIRWKLIVIWYRDCNAEVRKWHRIKTTPLTTGLVTMMIMICMYAFQHSGTKLTAPTTQHDIRRARAKKKSANV